MAANRCMSVPKSTIKRCRYYETIGLSGCCFSHNKLTNTDKNIQLYNGIILTLGEDDDIKSFTNPIFLWKIFNRDINNITTKSSKKIKGND